MSRNSLEKLNQIVGRYEGTYIQYSAESAKSHWLEEMTTSGDVHVQAHGTTLDAAIEAFWRKWSAANNVPRSAL